MSGIITCGGITGTLAEHKSRHLNRNQIFMKGSVTTMKAKRFLSALIAIFILSISITAFAATGSGVEPVLLRLTVGDAASEIAQTGCSAGFAFKIDNSAENGTYPTGDGNTITITSSDGYTFDWQSNWPVTCVLVKAGSNYYNAYFYPEGSYGDTGLCAAINPANGKPFGISHVTYGYNEPNMCYREETAWAKGLRYVTKGNWAMYTAYNGEEKTVDLIAGGGNSAGTVVGTATLEPAGAGYVKITIALTGGAIFYYDVDDPNLDDNVKIQGYAIAPSGNPAPGRFAIKAAVPANTTTYSVTVPANNFYGIHLDVAIPVPVV